MNNNDSRKNGLDSTSDIEHIKDIEKMIESHSTEAKNKGSNSEAHKTQQPHRYLRNQPHPAANPADKTVIIEKVKAERSNDKYSDSAKHENFKAEQIKKAETVPTASKKANTVKNENPDSSATVTMSSVKLPRVQNTVPDSKKIVTSRHPAVQKKEDNGYVPLETENDDFEIDENPEPDEIAVKGTIGAFTNIAKAIVYLVAVLAVSITLAVTFINVANDVFAFVKEDKEIIVEIPENCKTSELADILKENGAIKYPSVFNFYINFKHLDGEYIAGAHMVSPSMNYNYLIAEFKPKAPERTTVVITIPEGYSVDQIVKLLVEKGLGTYDGYVRAINEYDFDYRFINEMTDKSPDRFWRLEGYLYPDTYYYYSTSTEETVIYKMLENFNNKFTDEYYDRAEEMGMTVDEVVTLASLVEKEVKYADEYGNVSSVFHNRLNNPANFPHLDSDATIMYAIERDTGERPEKLKETSYDSPYNTYKCIGLPPGPIANPSMEAIRYAMYPNNTGYYYFVTGSSGRTEFSRTYAEHLEAIKNLE